MERGFASAEGIFTGPVCAGVASIPTRKNTLKKAVASILPQVDKLFVFLNGYETVPAFLEHPRIVVFRSQDHSDQNDRGKFFGLPHCRRGFYLTIDDDILYPSDYVLVLRSALRRYRYRAVVGVHGAVFRKWPISFFDKRTLHFSAKLSEDRPCSLLGTGTVAFHVPTIGLRLEDIKTGGMGDVWLARFMKQQGIPAVAVKRPAGWLQQLDLEVDDSLFSAVKRCSSVQETAMTQVAPWGASEIKERLGTKLRTFSATIRAGLDLGALMESADGSTAGVRSLISRYSRKELLGSLELIDLYGDRAGEVQVLAEICRQVPDTDALWLEALSVLRRKECIAALKLLREIETRRPLSSPERDLLSLMLQDAGDLKEAENVLSALLNDKLSSRRREACFARLMQLRYLLGDPAGVISAAAVSEQHNPFIGLLTSLSYLKLREPHAAEARLTAALLSSRDPTRSEARFFLAQLQEIESDTRSLLNLGRVLKALGDIEGRPIVSDLLRKIAVEIGDIAALETARVKASEAQSGTGTDPIVDAYFASAPDKVEACLNARLALASLALIEPGHCRTLSIFERVSRIQAAVCRDDARKISVIMSTFNAADTLDFAIRSILNQTYRNLELLIVDDVSTDGSLELARAWEQRDARVRVIQNEENVGPYVCRNIALAYATGELIAIQDADDASHPQRLERLAAEIVPGVVACSCRHVRLSLEERVVLEAGRDIVGNAPVGVVFDRSILDVVGKFATVRTRGDLEFEGRVRAYYGGSAVVSIDALLLFSLFSWSSNSRSATATLAGRQALMEFRRTFEVNNDIIARRSAQERARRLAQACAGAVIALVTGAVSAFGPFEAALLVTV